MRSAVLLAAALVGVAASSSRAEMPDFSGGRTFGAPLLSPGRAAFGNTWWTRFGEPVNSAALAAEPIASPSDQPGAPPLHGDGYVHGPGACDCPPPCIDHLWDGYVQNPKRCRGPLFGRGSCGNTCNTCANDCGCGKAAPACGCGAPIQCTSQVSSCGSGTPCCAPLKLFSFKGLFSRGSCGCTTCSAPVGCATCSSPVNGSGDIPATPEVLPEKQSVLKPPTPVADEPSLITVPRVN